MNRCKEYHRRDTVFLPHLMQWHMILICPVTDDIHLNHLIKVISVRFLYHVDIFPIEMNMNLVGGYIHILNIFHSWLYFQCIYSFIDICMDLRYVLYALDYHPIPLFFCFSNYSSSGHSELFHSVSIDRPQSFVLWALFLFSDPLRCSWFIMSVPFPSSRNS